MRDPLFLFLRRVRGKRKEKKKDKKKKKQVLERLKTGRVGCCEAALVSGCRVGLTMLEPCNFAYNSTVQKYNIRATSRPSSGI